jgi:hypothetical protein
MQVPLGRYNTLMPKHVTHQLDACLIQGVRGKAVARRVQDQLLWGTGRLDDPK